MGLALRKTAYGNSKPDLSPYLHWPAQEVKFTPTQGGFPRAGRFLIALPSSKNGVYSRENCLYG